MQNRRERSLHLMKHPRYLVNTILHRRKDHGTVTIHPEEPAGFHVLLSQTINPNNNMLLLLPWSKVSTCNTCTKVRCNASRRIRRNGQQLEKLTLKLLG